jgi:hypothetical protein
MRLLAKQVPSLSSHIPCDCAAHAALVLPQAWVILEISLCWLARGISAHLLNGAASRLRSGFSALAMPCRASGLWPLENDRSAEPGLPQCHRRSW